MSSKLSLNNLFAPGSLSSQKLPQRVESSGDFARAVSAVTAGDLSSAQQEALLPGTQTSLVVRPSSTSSESASKNEIGDEQQYSSSSENSAPDSSSTTNTDFADNYSQTNLDASSMGQSFLTLIQAVQEGDISQAQSALDKITRKFSASATPTTNTLWFVSTNPLQRFLNEMRTALSSNDIQAAQSSLNSFLENLGKTKGNFITTTA